MSLYFNLWELSLEDPIELCIGLPTFLEISGFAGSYDSKIMPFTRWNSHKLKYTALMGHCIASYLIMQSR